MRYDSYLYNFQRDVLDISIERQLKKDYSFKNRIQSIREDFTYEIQYSKLKDIFSMYEDFLAVPIGRMVFPVSVIYLCLYQKLELQFFTKKQKFVYYENEFYAEYTFQSNKKKTIIPISNNRFFTITKTFLFNTYDQMEQFVTHLSLTMDTGDLSVTLCPLPLTKKQLGANN